MCNIPEHNMYAYREKLKLSVILKKRYFNCTSLCRHYFGHILCMDIVLAFVNTSWTISLYNWEVSNNHTHIRSKQLPVCSKRKIYWRGRYYYVSGLYLTVYMFEKAFIYVMSCVIIVSPLYWTNPPSSYTCVSYHKLVVVRALLT